MTNEPYNQLTCQAISPHESQVTLHSHPHPPTPTPTPVPLHNKPTPPKKSQAISLGQFSTQLTNVAIPTMRFQYLKGLHGNCMQHCWGTTARGDKEPQTEGISTPEGVSRPDGAHDPNKQPHHHQKQRPSGDAAPVTGPCTRSGALHPIRRGALPTDRVQCPKTQEQTRNCQTEPLPATTSLSTGRQAGIGRVLGGFVTPSTHTAPERIK